MKNCRHTKISWIQQYITKAGRSRTKATCYSCGKVIKNWSPQATKRP